PSEFVRRYAALQLQLPPQLDPPTKPRPPVTDAPILWKEMYAEPLFRLGPGGQTAALVFGVLGALVLGYVVLLSMAALFSTGTPLGPFTHGAARFGGTGLTL